MEFRIIKGLVGQLEDAEVTRRFIEIVELRQRLYREHRETILILDQYDLICDHILLYSTEGSKLIGYLRSVSRETCQKYELAFPMDTLLGTRPEFGFAYQRFLKQAKTPMHMGYLCFDPAYKEELRGLKAIDFLGWLAFLHAGVPREDLALACTINTRYKQDAPMKLIGEWIPNLPDFQHPVVADLHRVVLIPKMAETYWDLQYAKFSSTLQTLGDGERDIFRDDKLIAA